MSALGRKRPLANGSYRPKANTRIQRTALKRLSSELTERNAFVSPSTTRHCLLNRLLHFLGAEAVVVHLPRRERLGERVRPAELELLLLAPERSDRNRQRRHAYAPFDPVLAVHGPDLVLRRIELEVDAEDLGEPGLGENLVPLRVHDLPLGDEIHALGLAIDQAIRSARTVEALELAKNLLLRQDRRARRRAP